MAEEGGEQQQEQDNEGQEDAEDERKEDDEKGRSLGWPLEQEKGDEVEDGGGGGGKGSAEWERPLGPSTRPWLPWERPQGL